MKILFISTPDVSQKLLESVCRLLNECNSSIEFNIGEGLSQIQFQRTNAKFKYINNQIPSEFSFEEFFEICDEYRHIRSVDDKIYVCLLTSITNNKNWFSASLEKNTFIDINGWDELTKKDPKYGIAYQVIENIFQLLIGIDCYNAAGHTNVHKKRTMGCINDYCEIKDDVMHKLKSSEICNSCQEAFRSKNDDEYLLISIGNIIETVRDNLKSFIIPKSAKPMKVFITQDNKKLKKTNEIKKGIKIMIGKKELKLEPLQKALFIYFLTHLDGVETNRIEKIKDPLENIYKKTKSGVLDKTIENISTYYFDGGITFSSTKSKLNFELYKQLSNALAEYYTINKISITSKDQIDRVDYYKVKITKEYIEITPELQIPQRYEKEQ